MWKRLRSSPAVLVAVLALVAALGGTAIAGSTSVTTAKKKKHKHKDAKDDTKLFNSLLKNATSAPKLVVAVAANAAHATNAQHAVSADTATTADSATTAGTATTAGSAQPAAFALVHTTATAATVSLAKGVTDANVTRADLGTVCITGLAFPIKGAQITTQFEGTGGTTGQFSVGATGVCPQGGQILLWNAAGSTKVDTDFYIVIYG
jgi:hypothetical protein